MARNKEETAEVEKPNMTPMIDVVFQLIVFFLVSMKFKTLDMKIEAFLPTDRGLAKTAAKPPDVPKIVAVLKRKRGEPVTRVKLGNQEVGDFGPARREETEKHLQQQARAARERAGDAADDVKGEVDAAPAVPAGDVIRAVDALIAGGLKDVTFVGTPEPGSTLDQIMNPGK